MNLIKLKNNNLKNWKKIVYRKEKDEYPIIILSTEGL